MDEINTLVVEDHQPQREALIEIFQRAGLKVGAAATLGEAIQALHVPTLKVVLLDLQLPDGSGMGILNRIRNHKLPLKVAVVTGSFEPSTQEKLDWLMPDAVFRKPCSPADLRQWVLEQMKAVNVTTTKPKAPTKA
ncbi:MAG TPA: response regulator [Tepidisphaeraceae bacterium]